MTLTHLALKYRKQGDKFDLTSGGGAMILSRSSGPMEIQERRNIITTSQQLSSGVSSLTQRHDLFTIR